MISCNKGRYIRLIFSEDVLFSLVKMHFKVWEYDMINSVRMTKEERLKKLRLQFARLADIAMPGIFVRVEPPTYDPHGRRIRREGIRGTQYSVQILASKLGLKDGVPSTHLEMLYQESSPGTLGGGMILLFPDEYMIYPGEKTPVKGPHDDLTVR